jgi:hypothetical protein
MLVTIISLVTRILTFIVIFSIVTLPLIVILGGYPLIVTIIRSIAVLVQVAI